MSDRSNFEPPAAAPPPADDPWRPLVLAIQDGHNVNSNFERLHKLTYRPVLNAFKRWGFGHEDCEELTQDTFNRVFTGIGSFRHDSSFKSWLYEIATNVYRNKVRALNAAKRAGREKSLEEFAEWSGEGEAHVPEPLMSSLPTPLDESLQHEREKALRDALSSLPPQMQRCLVLRLYQGLKYREIAKVMNISIDTVKAHLHQAKQRLKEMLQDVDDILPDGAAGGDDGGTS